MSVDPGVRTFSFPRIDRVVHGVGAFERVPRLVAGLGADRVMILTGRSLASGTPLVRELEAALGSRWVGTFDGLRQHAPRADVDAATEAVRAARADCLVGLGGSSVTDATKVVAVQVLGPQRPQSDLPMILVPTTLSAGEYTPASGMTGDEPGVKTYVVDPRMAPFAVVLDPLVTQPTPRELWLSTGVKAIDHACEAMWGPRPHPLTDALAADALGRLRRGLARSAADPDDLEARLECQIAAWMSMAGVVNVQVYLSHTLGHQIGARWDIPHGITSGITLPVVMRYLAPQRPDAMVRVATALGVDGADLDQPAIASAGAQVVAELVRELGLPTRLRGLGARPAEFPAVAAATVAAARSTGWGGALEAEVVEGLLAEMY